MRTSCPSLAVSLPAVLVFLASSPVLGAPFFSIDAASPSVPGVNNSDVFTAPGPIGGPPVLAIPAAGLGLVGAPFDELNAMTTPAPLNLFFFSVDRPSVGVAGAPPNVFSESGVGQAAGDVYASLLAGANTLSANQDVLGELPPIPPGVAAIPPIDNLDALDFHGGPGLIFALAPGHPYLGASALFGCGADLFFLSGAPAIPFAAMGLLGCADDVDALQIDSTTGDIWFSLAPGSPSLLPGSPIVGCAGGCSPADIFMAAGGAPPSTLVFPAAALGLLPTDNVDAMAWDPVPPVPSMSPFGMALLATLIGLGAVGAVHRGRISRSSARRI